MKRQNIDAQFTLCGIDGIAGCDEGGNRRLCIGEGGDRSFKSGIGLGKVRRGRKIGKAGGKADGNVAFRAPIDQMQGPFRRDGVEPVPFPPCPGSIIIFFLIGAGLIAFIFISL